MSLEKLVSKYIISTEYAFDEIEIVKNSVVVDEKMIKKVLESAKAYLEDAKYYKKEKKFETSLVSIAYCEGLLDALKMLQMVKFEWLTTREKENVK